MKEFKLIILIALFILTINNTIAAEVVGSSSIYTFEITDCQTDYSVVDCNQTTIKFECDINNQQFIEEVQFEINGVLYTTTKAGNNFYYNYIKPEQTSTIYTTINHTDVYITDTNDDTAHYENNYSSVINNCSVCEDVGSIGECTIYDNRTIYHIYEPSGCQADYNETVSCNYCSEDIQENRSECSIYNNQTLSYYDNNYDICCNVTNLISDCSILFTPYNETTVESCNYTCNEIWQPIYSCDENNVGFKYYEQITNCTIIDELPSDNGTYYDCVYQPENMILGYDNFMDTGTIERIEAIITEDGEKVDNSTQYAQIKFEGHTYNMNYDSENELFYIDVTEEDEKDISFTVMYYNSYDSNNTLNGTGIMRWRESFDITLTFYKQDMNDPDAQPTIYKNDFYYVYLLPDNGTSKIQTDKIGYVDYLEDWFGWIPGYGGDLSGYGITKKELDIQTAFWSVYNDGEAKIKLYEKGNYTIHLITNKMTGGEWPYEFIYPQFKSAKYRTKVASVEIRDETSTEYNVYMDAWEVFKFKLMMNLIYWIIAFIIYIIMVVILLKSPEGIKYLIPATIGYFTFMKLLGLAIF